MTVTSRGLLFGGNSIVNGEYPLIAQKYLIEYFVISKERSLATEKSSTPRIRFLAGARNDKRVSFYKCTICDLLG